MFAAIFAIALAYCLRANAVILPSCSTVANVRAPIGCFNTNENLLSPIATFTYVDGYNNTETPTYKNTLEMYCGLQCLALGTPYYVLYNITTCACVSVSGSPTLTSSSNCLATCPITSINGSKYCPSTTPHLGAYWFCTPQSECPSTDGVPQGPGVQFLHCLYAHFDARIEGDYIKAYCTAATDCLQLSALFQCTSGTYVNVGGQQRLLACVTCAQYPTNCSAVLVCNPSSPGTCSALATTTTTTLTTTTTTLPTTTTTLTTTTTTLPTTTNALPTTTSPTTTSITATLAATSPLVNINGNNVPWYGGNRRPLPSHKIYTLVNVTNYDSGDPPSGKEGKPNCSPPDSLFYLSWMDPRLEFNDKPTVGAPGSFFQLTQESEQNQLWIPPVYVGNTKANSSLLFLDSNGQSSMMYRQFTTAGCKMNLQDYPFDTQSCPIYLGLFGFYDQQVQLNWSVPVQFNMSNPSSPFSLNKKIRLSSWTITDYYIDSPEQSALTDAVCAKFRTCLLSKVVLRRKSSFYMIDTFLPNAVIMAGACLTFWINPENVPARVSMAVTLFLTFQAASLNVRSKLPSVTYVKAIDIWLFFGQGFLFLVMAEFLLVHTILNGYVMVCKRRIFGSNTKAVQTGENVINPNDAKASRQRNAKKVEKIAKVLFPLVMILFAAIYFSFYLSK